jgi:hypothetical protein
MAETENPYQTPLVEPVRGSLQRYEDGTLEVHSSLTVDDLLAFHLHYLRRGQAGARMPMPVRLAGYYVLLTLAGVVLSLAANSWLPLAVLLVVVTTVFSGWPKFVRTSLRRQIHAMLQGGRNLLVFGDQWIAVNSREIRRRTAWSCMQVMWEAVERVDLTHDYLFVFVTANSAFVIPLRDFATLEERDEFLRLSDESFQARRSAGDGN